jgi:hypothetical protein
MGAFSQGFAQGSGVGEEHRQRQRELEDEQRKTTLKTLQEDAETPQDKVAAIQAVYHKDPGVLKQHVENLTRRITGKQPQPVVTPEQAQQSRIAPLAARGKTPAQQDTEQFQQQTDYANKGRVDVAQQETQQKQQNAFALIDKYYPDPEENKAKKQDYVSKQTGIQANFKNLPGAGGQPYKTPNGQWVRPVESSDGSIAEQPMPAGYAGPQAKPSKPLYKVIRGHAVLLDPSTGNVIRDLGAAATARTSQHQSIQYDADGTPHMVTLTSVSAPGVGNIEVDTTPDEGGGEASKGPAPKGPAPKKSAGGTPQPKKDQLDFRKGTPAQTKARGEYDDAVKLSSLADQVAAKPNDAINQKRLAVALERTSAGRFTTQALDYIIKAGWGNTLEQWANNPSTGALPADVMRQLVDGAHQNQTAALKGLQAASTPTADLAPKGEPKVGDKKKFPNGKSGVWDGQGWVAQ